MSDRVGHLKVLNDNGHKEVCDDQAAKSKPCDYVETGKELCVPTLFAVHGGDDNRRPVIANKELDRRERATPKVRKSRARRGVDVVTERVSSTNHEREAKRGNEEQKVGKGNQ